MHLANYRSLTSPIDSSNEAKVLTCAERRQLLVEFNDTKADYPKDECVHQMFEEQVRRAPDRVAVVFEKQQLTYMQLNARANRLAHHLQTLGVGPEVPVAICMEHCPEIVVAVLGILKAGGAFLPLDPAYPKAGLAFMLQDAGSPVVLTRERWLEHVPDDAGRIVCLDSEWEVIARQSETNPVSGATAKDLAYVIYTSGSTGRPKGVMCEHAGLVNYLCWVNESPLGDPELCTPLTTKLTFDMCLKQLFPPLLRGDDVWILPAEAVAEPAPLL